MVQPASAPTPPSDPAADSVERVPCPCPKRRLRLRVLQGVALVGLLLGALCFGSAMSSMVNNGEPWSAVAIFLLGWLVPMGLLVELLRLRRAAAGCFSALCLIMLLWTPLLILWDMQALSSPQRTRIMIGWVIMWSIVPLLTLICWRDLESSPGLFRTRRKAGESQE